MRKRDKGGTAMIALEVDRPLADALDQRVKAEMSNRSNGQRLLDSLQHTG